MERNMCMYTQIPALNCASQCAPAQVNRNWCVRSERWAFTILCARAYQSYSQVALQLWRGCRPDLAVPDSAAVPEPRDTSFFFIPAPLGVQSLFLTSL